MQASNYKTKFLARWVGLTIFLIAVAARVVPGARTIDDSFITFRYAQNILAGNGFVYNPGERVLGTTTPLYTILLTVLGLFTGGTEAPFELLALGVNALADGLTCLLLLAIGRRMSKPIVGLAASLAWSVAPYSVTFAIGGLETSLYVLLLCLAIFAHLQNRRLLVALFAALSLLTRPDALIMLGPLALDRAMQCFKLHLRGKWSIQIVPGQLRLLRSEAWIFLAVYLPWLLSAALYFGSPLPHSITAKALAYRLPQEAGLVRLLQHYATPFMENISLGVPAIVAGFVLYPFFFLVGARALYKTNRRNWPWLIYPWTYLAVFALANPLIFRWYLTPPLLFYFFIVLFGLEEIINNVFLALGLLTTRSGQIFSQAGRVVMICAIPTIFLLQGWTLHPDHGLDQPAPQMAYYQLELFYRQAAEFLAPELSERTSAPLLAAGDVGVLGFFTHARILDTVGLNSPESTKYYPLDQSYYVINYAIPPDLIVDYQPDYVVILEVYGRNGLLIDPRFTQQYNLLHKIPTDIYSSDGLLIFGRSEK